MPNIVNCWKPNDIHIYGNQQPNQIIKKGKEVYYMPDTTIFPMIFTKNLPQNYNDYVPLVYQDIAIGRYLINVYGDIYSLKLKRIMRQDTNWAGYKRICLITEDGRKRNFSIHILVAATFLINPFPDSFTDVNHINGNKAYNFYMNLEYCTNNQNKHHASEMGLYEHGEDRYNAVYTDDFAREICSKFQDGIPYNEVYRYYQSIYPGTGSTIGSFIYKLYHRRTRSHITKEYQY